MGRRGIILIILAFIVVIVVISVIALIPRAHLVFSIAPTEATVSINGKTQSVKNQQSITVAPGELKIIVSRNDFGPYTETVTVKNGQTYEVIGALDPQTDAANKLMQTPEAMEVLQRVTDKKMRADTGKVTKENPLINDLPINDKYFSIIACASRKYPDDPLKIAICIKLYNPEAKQSALDTITGRGYKLADYEIVIIDSSYQQESGD
ncbi:MAG: PEGA domain-containing protein [Candidatus Saccharimonadales bacterium]